MIRLMTYINHAGLPYKAYAFTGQEALRKAVREHGLLFVLCAGQVYRELAADPCMHNIPIGCLTEVAGADGLTPYGLCENLLPDDLHSAREQTMEVVARPADRFLYRYRSASQLVEDITACVIPLLPEQRSAGMPVYMVYSPCARCGKTTLALELTRQLPGALYIGMETYNSLLEAAKQGSFGQLLYGIMQEDPAVCDRLQTIRQVWHNSYLVPSADAYYDLRVLDEPHMQWFLDALAQTGQYTAVVLDIGTGAIGEPGLLRLGQRIWVPVWEDAASQHKLDCMRNAMAVWDCQDIPDRMEVIPMQDRKGWEAGIPQLVRDRLHPGI